MRIAMVTAILLGLTGLWLSKGVWVIPEEPDELLMKLKAEDDDIKMDALLSIQETPERLAEPEIMRVLLEALLIQKELVRGAAEMTVEQCAEQVVPQLDGMLEDVGSREFVLAATAIRRIGMPAVSTAESLSKGLKSDTFEAKMSTLWAFENLGQAAQPYLSDLVDILNAEYPPGPDFNLRCGALRVISQIGESASSAFDSVLAASSDPNLSVRSTAYQTLGAIGPVPGHDPVAVLTEKLDAFYQIEKLRALDGLVQLGPLANPALPKIRDLMMDSNKSVMPQAAVTYYRISGQLAEPLKVLMATLENPTYELDSIDLIASIGSPAIEALPKIVERLSSSDESIREAAVIAIGKMGPAASSVTAKIRVIANSDSDQLIRQHAKRALRKLEGN